MEIRIPTGHWVAALCRTISSAQDGDTFVLPSIAHVHAFEIAQKDTETRKHFKVRVQP